MSKKNRTQKTATEVAAPVAAPAEVKAEPQVTEKKAKAEPKPKHNAKVLGYVQAIREQLGERVAGLSDDQIAKTNQLWRCATVEKAVKYAVSLGLDVMYVTEDTSRCDPEMVKRLYRTAINHGARAIVICDTAGHATPMGAFGLVRFILDEVVKPSGVKVRVDWHGHCDRGLAIANSMAALLAGADCVHACALGVGERVGNTQMDQMLVNLKLMGIEPWEHQDLTKLKQYCQAVSRATRVPIPANYPVVGEDAFRTATGVHAAAVIKAYRKNDLELANTVYSGVPAHVFGLQQVIDIGPMSGKSNVYFWLERHGFTITEELVERIYKLAKASDHTLSEVEILGCVETSGASRPT